MQGRQSLTDAEVAELKKRAKQELRPGDDDTVRAMRAKLAADGYRFGTLVESIVTSPQFLSSATDGGHPTEPTR